MLRCPHCHGDLSRHDGVWRCDAGHSFDVARQGYVNLAVGGPAHPGDSAAMLDARTAVLDAGHLDVVSEGVVAACAGLPPGGLVEVGAGTAHHLRRVLRALGSRPAVAMDVATAAARRAARGEPTVTSVVADAWQAWPLRDACAAAVLTVFAPRNPPEAARVLVPGGRLVVATPAEDHLVELRGPLGLLDIEPGKGERLAAGVEGHLEPGDVREVRTRRHLDRAAARAMAEMSPSAHHLDPEDLEARVADLPEPVTVTVAVRISVFRAPAPAG